MVPAPYWVAARISAAARGLTGRRIAGQYALATGRDAADLPPHVWHTMVEAWLWDHFTEQKHADRWVEMLDRPCRLDLDTLDYWAVCARAALTVAGELLGRAATPDFTLDAVPAGWDNDALLADMMAAAAAG